MQTRSGSGRGSERPARPREERGLSGEGWGCRDRGAGSRTRTGAHGGPLVWPHLPSPNRSWMFGFIHEMAPSLGFGDEAPSG